MSDSSKHVTDLLPDLLHGRLEGATRAEVETHLAACVDCRAELELLARAKQALVAPRMDFTRVAAAVPTYGATRRHRIGTRIMQIAAVITVIATALSAVAKLSHDRERDVVRREPAVNSSPAVQRSADESVQVAKAPPKTAPATAELATGETLHDLTESELRALLEEIAALDGIPSSETEVVVPSVGKGAQ